MWQIKEKSTGEHIQLATWRLHCVTQVQRPTLSETSQKGRKALSVTDDKKNNVLYYEEIVDLHHLVNHSVISREAVCFK